MGSVLEMIKAMHRRLSFTERSLILFIGIILTAIVFLWVELASISHPFRGVSDLSITSEPHIGYKEPLCESPENANVHMHFICIYAIRQL